MRLDMKIFDISQEVFSCEVYSGDPPPKKERLSAIDNGDLYNLTAFSMCAHNGTHIDAPYHFINDGNTIDEITLDATVGYAYVYESNGIIDGKTAEKIINKAKNINLESAKRILLKGQLTVSEEAAEVFALEKLFLLGNESQTVGPIEAPIKVHNILLSANVVLLEGIRLENIDEGVYFLSASPLLLKGADGSPCRAILIKDI